MKTITEIKRLAAPAPLPQSLAWDGEALWMGSLRTKKIYQIDPVSWSVLWEAEAPGRPFGMTVVDEELRVLCGETEADNRFIRRCVPGTGFDPVFKIPCPDDTGSQLGYDGVTLHVSQWYTKKVLALGEDGQIKRAYDVPRGICGQVILHGSLYLVTTDDEETDQYFLTRLDPSTGASEDLAHIPFPARALAHDGVNFWTNHRAAGETVCFRI